MQGKMNVEVFIKKNSFHKMENDKQNNEKHPDYFQ